MASTVSMVFKIGLSFRAYMGGINCKHGVQGWLIFQGPHGWHQLCAWCSRLAYISGPTWVASIVIMVFKVGLSFRAYMGVINCKQSV